MTEGAFASGAGEERKHKKSVSAFIIKDQTHVVLSCCNGPKHKPPGRKQAKILGIIAWLCHSIFFLTKERKIEERKGGRKRDRRKDKRKVEEKKEGPCKVCCKSHTL